MTMQITNMFIYPVKALGGIELQESLVLKSGLKWDRNWMVVDKDGNFVSQRQLGAMATLAVALGDQTLTIRSKAGVPLVVPFENSVGPRREVIIWGTKCLAQDEGDEASRFLTDNLGPYRGGPLHLVRMAPEFIRSVPKKETFWPEANTKFADAYPFLVISEESLADLNQRLSSRNVGPLPMNRFRPNLVVTGLGPYGEDKNPTLKFESGLEIQLVSHCVRCKVTTIDQTSGVASEEPLKIFSEYRRNPQGKGVIFGQNAILKSGPDTMARTGMSFTI
jgi:uncharacterized protein YcbX